MTWWEFIGVGAGGLVALLAGALGVLMVAQRAKAWWVSRGDDDEVPAEEMPTDDLWEAVEVALSRQKVVDRRFRALMKAQKLPLYRRIPGLPARLGAGRRTS